MSISKTFKVSTQHDFHLSQVDPDQTHDFKNKAAAAEALQHYAQRLRELRYLLYAEGKQGLLICLQALDAGGKDGTIRHVLGYMNPQGCRVPAFKVPTPDEAAHDFLWRVRRVTPARGEVVIFNPENMSAKQWRDFKTLRESALKTARAWAIKELAMSLWHYVSKTWTEKGWKRWLSWAVRSQLDPIKKVAKTIKEHLGHPERGCAEGEQRPRRRDQQPHQDDQSA